MKRYILAAVVFISVLAISAFTAWLAGYNFDHRSEEVSMNFLGTLIIGFWCAICTFLFTEFK